MTTKQREVVREVVSQNRIYNFSGERRSNSRMEGRLHGLASCQNPFTTSSAAPRLGNPERDAHSASLSVLGVLPLRPYSCVTEGRSCKSRMYIGGIYNFATSLHRNELHVETKLRLATSYSHNDLGPLFCRSCKSVLSVTAPPKKSEPCRS